MIAHLEDLMSVHSAKTDPDPNLSNACSRNNGGCSHLCLMTPKGARCQCPNGQELTDGALNCVVPEAFILYTRRTMVGRVSMKTSAGAGSDGFTLPIDGIMDASALDFDSRDGRIYWSDIEEKTISRVFTNGTGLEVVLEFGLDYPDGMAVDWVAGNLYWTDMYLHRIEVRLELQTNFPSIFLTLRAFSGFPHGRRIPSRPHLGRPDQAVEHRSEPVRRAHVLEQLGSRASHRAGRHGWRQQTDLHLPSGTRKWPHH
jgi:hypothetical protein